MKAPKKRDKKYKKKVICNPLGIRNDYMAEIPLLTAVDLIGKPEFDYSHAAYIMSFACLMERLGAPEESFAPVQQAIDAAMLRDEQHPSLTSEEGDAIRKAFPLLVAHYRSVSNYKIVDASMKMIKEIERAS